MEGRKIHFIFTRGEREISDNGTTESGCEGGGTSDESESLIFCLGEETCGASRVPSPPPLVRCPAVYFRPSVTWKRKRIPICQSFTCQNALSYWLPAFLTPPPIFHNGCCHSRRSRFRRECRRHASPKNFLQDRLSGSGYGGASSGLPKRHSPLTFRFAFPSLLFLLYPRFSSLPAYSIQWWR